SASAVRIAIYVQNPLNFIIAIWALRDGNVSEYDELQSVKMQSPTVLITASAILISSMVEARTVGLFSFHTSIVFSSNCCNTNTFTYFPLFLQRQRSPG
ncbi:hypothetical protein B0H11DRAFT_1729236, partial [Mycena galericulata]